MRTARGQTRRVLQDAGRYTLTELCNASGNEPADVADFTRLGILLDPGDDGYRDEHALVLTHARELRDAGLSDRVLQRMFFEHHVAVAGLSTDERLVRRATYATLGPHVTSQIRCSPRVTL